MAIDPTDLAVVSEALVTVDNEPVGRLERLPDRVRFRYLPDASTPVATSLPLRVDPYDTHAAGAVPPFFAGLLPEGRRLTAIRQTLKIAADDDFSMLLAVGGDTIGNVSITPMDDQLAIDLVPSLDLGNTDTSTAAFDDLFERSMGATYDPFGVPGVQPKVSARMITLAVRRSGSKLATHILKLNPPEFPHLVENEAFFTQAAQVSGIETANVRLITDSVGRPGLVVERFDRVVEARQIRRLAQEDACQILRRFPADKYAVTTEQIADGLTAMCGAPIPAAARLLRQLAFAYVSCNGDAHAKNFSVLRSNDEWGISPAYDVPSSYPYGDRTVALTINGKRDERIGRADLLDLAGRLRLREKPATAIAEEVADAVDLWIGRLDSLPFDGRRLHDLDRAIRYRQRRLRGL